MDVIKRRVAARNGVVAGSVWESRMKSDEVKGGIRVFNGEEISEEGATTGGVGDKGLHVYRRLKRNQNGGVTGKRKTWNERSPFQMRKTRSELKKLSNESSKELSVPVDSIEKSPNQIRKTKSDTHRVSDESCKELEVSVDENGKSPIQLRKSRSDSHRVPDEPTKEIQISQEKIMSRTVSNASLVNSPRRLGVDDDGVDADGEDEGEDEEDDMEIEVDKKSYDVKEVNIAEEKPIDISEQKLKSVEEVEEEEEEKNQIPETSIPISENVNDKPSPVIDRPVIDLTQPNKVLNEEKKLHQIQQKQKRIFSKAIKQQSVVSSPPLIDPSLRKPPPTAVPEVFNRSQDTPNKLQNLVDLVMWRDVSKSAFVFGVGSFFLLSSSFTKDINFSLISAISYMGLVYLAAIFFYKSILCRGFTDMDDSNKEYIVGEQEAIWVLKLILPYLNEFLLKLRSIFSGDPATTMKLAVLLFVLARCGSSITVWKMAKLGFFAVFTVPKVCSSYSHQLTAYGKFWIGRFRDAWDSCTHKKAVAAAVFTLVWNFSSVVARVWAVFMLVVAVRYYQQSLLSEEEWGVEGECGGQRQENDGPTTVKDKKGC